MVRFDAGIARRRPRIDVTAAAPRSRVVTGGQDHELGGVTRAVGEKDGHAGAVLFDRHAFGVNNRQPGRPIAAPGKWRERAREVFAVKCARDKHTSQRSRRCRRPAAAFAQPVAELIRFAVDGAHGAGRDIKEM